MDDFLNTFWHYLTFKGSENVKKSEEQNKNLDEDLEHPEFNENVDPKKLVELLFGISQEDTEEFATKKGYDSIADEDEVIEELLNETAKGGLISESFSIRLKSPKNYPKALFWAYFFRWIANLHNTLSYFQLKKVQHKAF